MENRKIDVLQGAKIVVELTPEQLGNLMTEAALKAVELSKLKPDHWEELPNLLKAPEAAKALKISLSSFRRRVNEGFFIRRYEKEGGHPVFDKAELREFYLRIVSE